jgi:hypothetical protein
MQHAVTDANNEKTKRFQCRHIFTDGRRCGSACLRHEEFCYYHHTTRKPIENPRQRRNRRSTFDLPLPEDRSAIQCSIGQVLRRIASNEIDPRRAGLLLYGLQIASLNLPRDPTLSRKAAPASVPETVEEITIDPVLGPLAPRAEVGKTQRRLSVVGALLQSLTEQAKAEDDAALKSQRNQQTDPTILPTINAAAQASNQPADSPVDPTADDQPKLALSRAHHRHRRQVFLHILSPELQLVQARPGDLLEIVRGLQHRPGNLNRRISLGGALKYIQHSLRSKVRFASLGLDDALGDEQQLCPRFKRLHRRFVRHMREQTHRHRDVWQDACTLRVAKYCRNTARVDIRKQPERQVVATDKSRREPYSVSRSYQCMIDLLHQLGRPIHQVRIVDPEELSPGSTKGFLHCRRDRLCLFLGPRDIGQQNDNMRAKIDRIEEVAARARRKVLGMQVEILMRLKIQRHWSPARRSRTGLRRTHGVLL